MKQILKTGLTFLALLLAAEVLRAQNVVVEGSVYDENNKPLPGTAVIVLGTQTGTTSDARGHFSLKAKKGQTLEFSFIGYKTKQMQVGERMSGLSVSMETEASAIEEVVVSVGYGQMAKKDISGSVTTVRNADLQRGPVSANFSDALAGRMAGVQVSSSEGGPGAGIDITIRGGNSLTGSNSPLWVIDGFPVEDPNTFSLDPKDIEQMQVLKDASATAIYGARGANGVIIVETKKGGSADGSTVVEYNGRFSVSTLPAERKMDLIQGIDWLYMNAAISEAYSSSGFNSFADRYLVTDLYKRVSPDGPYQLDETGSKIPLTYANAAEWEKLTIEDYRDLPWTMHDWQDEAFKTAITHSHRVAVSGGSKSTRYNLSTDIFMQDGLLLKTGLDRYNIRGSIDQWISNKIKFVGQVNYNATRRHGLQSNEGNRNSIIRDILQYQPVNPMKYGDLGVEGVPTDVEADKNNLTYQPILNINNSYREYYLDEVKLNGTINYYILKPLRLMVRGGYSHYTIVDDTYNNSKSRYGHPILSADGINAKKVQFVRDTWFNEYTLNYARTWGRHRFDAMVGYTMDGYRSKSITNSYIQFPTDILGMDDLSQGTAKPAVNSIEEYFTMSFLGRVNYVYADKYIFTASFRADGSSKFMQGNRFAYFPSGAVAWRVSQEPFLRDVYWLSDLKLRGSWGLTGNNRIGGSSAYGALGSSANTGYMFDNSLVGGYQPSRIDNPDPDQPELVPELQGRPVHRAGRTPGLDVLRLHLRRGLPNGGFLLCRRQIRRQAGCSASDRGAGESRTRASEIPGSGRRRGHQRQRHDHHRGSEPRALRRIHEHLRNAQLRPFDLLHVGLRERDSECEQRAADEFRQCAQQLPFGGARLLDADESDECGLEAVFVRPVRDVAVDRGRQLPAVAEHHAGV